MRPVILIKLIFFDDLKKELRKTAVKVRVFWQLVFEWLEIVLSSRSSSKTFQENYDSVTQGKSDVRGPRLPKELSGTARRLLPCSFTTISVYSRMCFTFELWTRCSFSWFVPLIIQFQSTSDRTSSNVTYWQYKMVKHVVCDIMVKLMVGLCGRRVILHKQLHSLYFPKRNMKPFYVLNWASRSR